MKSEKRKDKEDKGGGQSRKYTKGHKKRNHTEKMIEHKEKGKSDRRGYISRNRGKNNGDSNAKSKE